jgi:NAD(P)H-dependent FMN reductase
LPPKRLEEIPGNAHRKFIRRQRPLDPRAHMTTLLLVSGSQRRESLNARLLSDLADRLAVRCTVDSLEPAEVGLPLFDQDLERDSAVVGRVAALHRRFSGSDGIIVASPEYNGQLPPYLKNLIDWVSRLAYVDGRFCSPFRDRPVLLCSASTGWSGGAVAIPHARALFGYVGCLVIGDTVCIPHADQAWNGDGYAFDPLFDSQVDAAIEQVLQLAAAFAQTRQRPQAPEVA